MTSMDGNKLSYARGAMMKDVHNITLQRTHWHWLGLAWLGSKRIEIKISPEKAETQLFAGVYTEPKMVLDFQKHLLPNFFFILCDIRDTTNWTHVLAISFYCLTKINFLQNTHSILSFFMYNKMMCINWHFSKNMSWLRIRKSESKPEKKNRN